MSEQLRFEGKIKSGTVSKTADEWFIALTVKTSFTPSKTQTGIIGVDLGITKLATLSNGEEIEGAKTLKFLTKRIRRLQRRLSKTKNAKDQKIEEKRKWN